MLGDIFISVLNMSLVSSFVILFVILARYLLKKAPKIYSYSLWSFVLFRLVCPDSFLSTLSIIPINSKPISPDIIYSQAPSINTGITALDNSVSAVLPTATPYASMNPMQGLMHIGIFIWLIGIAALIIYSIVSLVMLKSQLKGTHYKENIYFCGGIKTPFVIGIFKPKIYLPSQIKESELEYVVLHERTHIRRLDHVIKIAAFLVLCVHWFNPLVWLAFFLFGKDMEMSCDESVVKKLGYEIKKEYSTSLLSFATGKRIINATPLAFGEGDTKGRIKNLLGYKKPAFGVAVILTVAVVILGISLLGNNMSEERAAVDLSDIETMNMGAELPILRYCDDDKAVMQGTFGFLVYDLKREQSTARLGFDELNKADIRFPWGDVSQNAKGIYIFDEVRSPQLTPPYTHYYDIKERRLEKISSKHLGMAVIPHPTTENDGKYDKFFGDYLVGQTLVEREDRFFYLRANSFDMKDLELVEQRYDNRSKKVWRIFESAVKQAVGVGWKSGEAPSTLDGAIQKAVLEQNGYENFDVAYESHLILANSGMMPADDISTVVFEEAYAVTLFRGYNLKDGRVDPSSLKESFLPIAVGFDIGKSGEYILSKYLAPRDGVNYDADVVEIFSQELSESFLDISKHYDSLNRQILAQMAADGYIDEVPAEPTSPKAVPISNMELAKGETILKNASKAEVKLVMTNVSSNITIDAKNVPLRIIKSENDAIAYQYDETLFDVKVSSKGQELSFTIRDKGEEKAKEKKVTLYLPEKTTQRISLAADESAVEIGGFNADINVSGAGNAVSLSVPAGFSKTFGCVLNGSSISAAFDKKADNYTFSLNVKNCVGSVPSYFSNYKHGMKEYEYKKGNGSAVIRLELSESAFSVE